MHQYGDRPHGYDGYQADNKKYPRCRAFPASFIFHAIGTLSIHLGSHAEKFVFLPVRMHWVTAFSATLI
jgi:hypothetical protein